MLPLNDISNLLTLMVTWDNSFQYQNICVIAHKNEGENFIQLALFLFVWTTCLAEVAGCKSYFALTLIWQNRHFQVWREMFTTYSSLEYSEFILSFSTVVWNIWSRKWTFSIGKRKTPFQRVVLKISRPFIFWLSCWCSISEASI